jgi:flagellar protein FliO/FliZ
MRRISRTAAALALLALWAPLLGAQEAAQTRIGSAAPAVDAGQFVRLVLALALVVALIYVCAWLLRRVQGLAPGRHGVVRVLGSASVGQRERAVLVQVGGQQLLLGVAPGSVRTLHTFEQPVVVPEQAPGPAGSNPLRALLSGRER